MAAALAFLAAPVAFGSGGCSRGAPAASGADPADDAPQPQVKVSVAVVRRATVRTTIPVTGTLAPLPNEEARVAPLFPGRVSQVFVRTGDRVARGQRIATMEAGPLTGQLQQARGAEQADRVALLQARLNLTVQKTEQQSAVAQAKANLATQQVALKKLLAGSRPQEIAQAQTAVTAAAAALTNAEQNLARTQTLYDHGILARKDLEGAQAQQKTALAQQASAEAALSLARQGNRPEDIEAGRVAVQQAEVQLQTAEAMKVQTDAKAEDIRIAEEQLAGAHGAVVALQSQVAALTICAPLAGTIVTRPVNPGESIDTTGTIASIVNLDRVRVLLNVPQDAIGSVRAGQLVTFSTEAQPAVRHVARITVINSAVDPTTNTVRAECVADNPAHVLRDDGFVRGDIEVAAHRNVVVVPAAAIVQKGTSPVAFVIGSDNAAHSARLTLGLRSGSFVEARSGVHPGELVATAGAFELNDGMRVAIAR